MNESQNNLDQAAESKSEIESKIKAQELKEARRKALFFGLISAVVSFCFGLSDKHWHFITLVEFPIAAFILGFLASYAFFGRKYVEGTPGLNSLDEEQKRIHEDNRLTNPRNYDFNFPSDSHKFIELIQSSNTYDSNKGH